MLILLDTNALIMTVPTELSSLEELAEYALQSGAVVLVPEVVETEFAAHLDREFAEAEAKIQTIARRLPPDVAKSIAFEQFRKATSASKRRLTAKLRKLASGKRFLRVRITSAHTRRAVARATKRQPPCSPSGEQLRDALIWEAAVAYANAETGPLVVISADRTFQSEELTTEIGSLGTDLVLFPSIPALLQEVLLEQEAIAPAALEAILDGSQLASNLAFYVASDPAGEWYGAIENFIENVADLFLDDYRVVSFHDIRVQNAFRVPIGRRKYNTHVEFEAVATVMCEAYGAKVIPPTGDSFEDVSDDGLRRLLAMLPQRVPDGQLKQVGIDLGLSGQAIYTEDTRSNTTNLLAVFADPIEAGYSGQARESKRIDFEDFMAALRTSGKSKRGRRKGSNTASVDEFDPLEE